jgi:hypothetical protein
MILPTEVMCIESASILNQTNARASSFTLKFFIICQNRFWKKAFPSGLTFVSYNIELTCAADPGLASRLWYKRMPRLTFKARRQVQRFVRRLMSNTSYQYFISHAKNISTFLNRDGGQLLYPTCTQVSSGDECRPSIGAVVKQERATCAQVSFRNERRPICPSIYFSNCGSQSKKWSLLT